MRFLTPKADFVALGDFTAFTGNDEWLGTRSFCLNLMKVCSSFKENDRCFVSVPHNNRSLWMEAAVARVSHDPVTNEETAIILVRTADEERVGSGGNEITFVQSDYRDKLRRRE